MRVIGERQDWMFKHKVKDLVGDEYSVLGYYRGIHKKILFQHNCEYCGNFQFQMNPHEFLKGERCPYCQKHYKKTTSDFVREIRYLFKGKFTVISEYTGPRNKVRIRCNSCGRERFIYPYQIEDLYHSKYHCFCEQQADERKQFSEAFKAHKLGFIESYKVSDPLTNIGPKFDFLFSVGDKKIAVDYLDLSHYKSIYYDKERYEIIKNWDKIKKEFVDINGIFYLGIGFWNIGRADELAEILSKFLTGRHFLSKKRFEALKASMNLGSFKNEGKVMINESKTRKS